MVFDKNWFARHQRKLLWLLNAPLVKRWFRWVMRIRKDDLPIGKAISGFGPNFFTYDVSESDGVVTATTQFHSNEKYARRIWFAFEPIWWAIHAWDMVTRPWPVLNLGFDTLPTKYSTPGSTVSGDARRIVSSETFSTIHDGAGTNKTNDSGYMYAQVKASTISNQFDRIFRSIFLFDTSALGVSATVTGAVVGLYGEGKTNGLGSFEVDIVSSNPASDTVLENADYQDLGNTPFSSVSYASLVTADYNQFTMDSNGISNISKTGISKFGARVNWDTDNSFGGSWSSDASSNIQFRDGGTAGTSSDPKIDVTYTLPAVVGAGFLFLMA